jgi:hypothetical protein
MVISLLLAVSLAQAPAKPADVTLMKAGLGGSCSADFIVKGPDGKPIDAAMVHALRQVDAGVGHLGSLYASTGGRYAPTCRSVRGAGAV